jgi:hypothetical protein
MHHQQYGHAAEPCIGIGIPVSGSVRYCWPAEEKIRPPVIRTSLNAFGNGIKKKNIFDYVSRKSITFLGLSYKRENQKRIYLFFQKFDPSSALLNKIGHNLAAYFSGHSTFYSAPVELCSRTIGQLATLVIVKVKEPCFLCMDRFNGSQNQRS